MNGNTDPKRPIKAAEPLVDIRLCIHPWNRIAIIKFPWKDEYSLQCFDCAAIMQANGHPLTFKL